MKTVIDTNVFVESLSKTSVYHKIFKSLLLGDFFICISNPILLEYEEIIRSLHSSENAERLFEFLTLSPFVIFVNPTYYYNLISMDPDDNKFVDCAIAANADFIIASDRHFNILKTVPFPKVGIIHPKKFIEKYLT